MSKSFVIFLFILFSLVDLAYADGMYVSDYHAHLYEPSQKAVITWDGTKETMILSAAVKSVESCNRVLHHTKNGIFK